MMLLVDVFEQAPFSAQGKKGAATLRVKSLSKITDYTAHFVENTVITGTQRQRQRMQTLTMNMDLSEMSSGPMFSLTVIMYVALVRAGSTARE